MGRGVRRGLLLLVAVLAAGGCSGAADEPDPPLTPAASVHSDPAPAPAPAPTAEVSTSAGAALTGAAACPEAPAAPSGVSRTGRWQRMALPARATRTGGVLLSVATVGPRAAWAVGYMPSSHASVTGAGGGARTTGLVLGWDGVRWKIQPLPAGIASVRQVAAVSRTEAWAVGVEDADDALSRTHVLRWDGRSWSKVPLAGSSIGAGTRIAAVAADACGRVYVGGQGGGQGGGQDGDQDSGPLVARHQAGGWVKLPAPSSDSRGAVSFLSIAPGSQVRAGVLHDNGAEVMSWDAGAWHQDKLLFGSHVSLYRLDTFTEDHVWYISNLSWTGGPMNRPVPRGQVFAATLEPGPDLPDSADPRALGLPSISLLAGWDDVQWLYGYGGVLAQRVDDRWVRRNERLPARFAPHDLRAVPGSGQLLMVGNRQLTADGGLRNADRTGTATVVRYLPG